MLAPKNVMMLLIPKTKMVQRIGMTHQRSHISAVTSTHMIQHKRNQHYPMLRSSLSSTASEDNDTNNIATTTPVVGDKSSAEIEAVQAAREARKYG
jgi:hypothetical protein